MLFVCRKKEEKFLLEDHLGRQVLIVFILILVNAFFAGAEIAVISLNGNIMQ